jgi:hypothetical protein
MFPKHLRWYRSRGILLGFMLSITLAACITVDCKDCGKCGEGTGDICYSKLLTVAEGGCNAGSRPCRSNPGTCSGGGQCQTMNHPNCVCACPPL